MTDFLPESDADDRGNTATLSVSSATVQATVGGKRSAADATVPPIGNPNAGKTTLFKPPYFYFFSSSLPRDLGKRSTRINPRSISPNLELILANAGGTRQPDRYELSVHKLARALRPVLTQGSETNDAHSSASTRARMEKPPSPSGLRT